MSEVPSRYALDGTSFDVKLCLRRGMVELMGESGSSTRDSALFHLDLAQLQRILYATFMPRQSGG